MGGAHVVWHGVFPHCRTERVFGGDYTCAGAIHLNAMGALVQQELCGSLNNQWSNIKQTCCKAPPTKAPGKTFCCVSFWIKQITWSTGVLGLHLNFRLFLSSLDPF
jgi:hypothetical protein